MITITCVTYMCKRNFRFELQLSGNWQNDIFFTILSQISHAQKNRNFKSILQKDRPTASTIWNYAKPVTCSLRHRPLFTKLFTPAEPSLFPTTKHIISQLLSPERKVLFFSLSLPLSLSLSPLSLSLSLSPSLSFSLSRASRFSDWAVLVLNGQMS